MKTKLLILLILLTACSDAPTVRPTAEQQTAIEKGLNRAFTKAQCLGYSRNLSVQAYQIETVPGQIVNGINVFRVNTDDYEDTDFDKGGYVYAAGQFQPPAKIVVPQYFDNFDALATVVEYEAEHRILYDNNRAEYDRTKVHGIGTGHPLFTCPTK